jgi:hypothetical protein
VTTGLVGEETGENTLLGIEGFWLFLCSLIFFGSQTEKVICYLLFLLYPCVVLVLDNVLYITPHNCKVHLILVVGDGSKILDFFFPYRL